MLLLTIIMSGAGYLLLTAEDEEIWNLLII